MKYLVVGTLNGMLGSVDGTLIIDENDPARSSVRASIHVAAISTGIRLRDKHLRSSDFFDAVRFPRVTFHSTRVAVSATNHLRLQGDLTIRNITREVTLDGVYETLAAEASGRRGAHFTATTTLSRREFGLGTGAIESARLVAGDRVSVTLDIIAVSE